MRRISVLLFTCAVVVGLSAEGLAAAGPVVPAGAATGPTASAAHTAEPTHRLTVAHRYGFVPLHAGAGAPAVRGTASPLAAPCEVTCSQIHMSYFGGPVISDAQVEGVYWGSGTYTSGGGPGEQMPAFVDAVGSSSWWAPLTEYNTNIAYSGGQGTDQVIGTVSSIGETTISPSSADNGTTITDAEMQTELAAQIASGSVPAPTLDAQGNVKTDYALYFPNGKKLCLAAGECNTNDFCAYHNTMSYDGLAIPYMVFPAFVAGNPDSSGCGVLPSLFDDFTSTVSHELVESVTDPDIGLDTASGYAYPAAWGDNGNGVGEIMDACDTGAAASASDVAGYYVQAMWSNAADACIFTRPYDNLSPALSTIASGSSEIYTAIGDGTDVTGQTVFSISPNGGSTGASCSGNACTASEPGFYTVSGTWAGVTVDTVDLTVVGVCSPGTYSSTGHLPCTPAPAGTYVDTSGATAPTYCPVGSYSSSPGATSCDLAPIDTYVDSVGATTATACPPATFTLAAGSTSISDCVAMAITTSSLPDGTVYSKANKVSYSATLAAYGGNPPYKWALAAGSDPLPAGLKLTSKGVIKGKATTVGTYSFTVRVVDTKTRTKPATQHVATRVLTITIA